MMANFIRSDDTAVNADRILRAELDRESGACRIQFDDGNTLIIRGSDAKDFWIWMLQNSADITRGAE